VNILRRALVGFKSFTMRWGYSRPSWWGASMGRTRVDYAGLVGDGRGNSIVAACLKWIGRTLPEAPMQVVRTEGDGSETVVRDHPLTVLLRRPNPYYSGAVLLEATASDLKATGDAYWLKQRSAAGRVVQLWWVPSTLIEPKWPDDGTVFISHYEYAPDGRSAPIRLKAPDPVDPAVTGDVVHFRNGIDPRNPRKGLSEIAALVREIATDDEAASFTASLLRNMAVPGMIIAPDDADTSVTQEDAEQIKAEAAARFGGDNRGSVMVMSAKVKVTPLSFSPQQMDMRVLRGIPEERISAMIGVPAAVVGLGSGLANTKVGATMAEMREQAFENVIIPTQRLIAGEVAAQLLPDLGNPATERVEFDLSEVRVLQPDLDALHKRLDTAVRGGWMTPNEARAQVDLDPLPGGDVVYVPIAVTPTDPAELVPPEPVDQPPPPAGLGEPPPLRALTQPPKGGGRLPEAKAGRRSLADGLTRLRARHHAGLERDLARYLDQQQARVLAALEQAKGHPLAEAKALDWSAVFDLLGETRSLTSLLQKWYRRVLGGVHALTEDALGASFDLDDPTTRAYLAEAGKQIGGITETTRAAIAAALQEGQAAGEGIPQLATRIQALTDFSRARAETISRTELGHAANSAALTTYRASDVVHGVEIFDGDGCGLRSHDDPQKANGVKLRLDQMADVPSLAHPRCVRAFGAITDPSELEGVA
jgi:HK97 family phage portal protein